MARGVPLGITMTTGTLAAVICCAVPSAVTGPGIDARLGVLAVGLAAFAAWVVDTAAVAVSVGVGSLLFDGFVEGHRGDLVWHGRADLVRLGVLCLAAALGLLLGGVRRWRERRCLERRRGAMDPTASVDRRAGATAGVATGVAATADVQDGPAPGPSHAPAPPLVPRQRVPQPSGSTRPLD
ncbi:MAG TPA: hypothetical protein VMT69_04560 [Kineosporiaceae bacterium]|nr:hypothetical protein [Kineosporiaceae bacterium]